METIGLLHSGSENAFKRQVAAMITGLAVKGYSKDVHYIIKALWADDKKDKLYDNAKSLAEDKGVSLIVAAGGPAPAIVARDITKRLEPDVSKRKSVVFTTVVDPLGNGLVGENLTGMAGQTSEYDDDRLRKLATLLKPAPGRKGKVKVFYKAGRVGLANHKAYIEGVAKNELYLDAPDPQEVDNDDDIDNSFSAGWGNVDGVLVTADAFFNNRRKKIVDKIANKRLPAIYQWREFVEAGGLMSYGPSILEAYVFAGVYAARILFDGEKPADIEPSKPTWYELVINRRVDHDLGNIVPKALYDEAVEVIE